MTFLTHAYLVIARQRFSFYPNFSLLSSNAQSLWIARLKFSTAKSFSFDREDPLLLQSDFAVPLVAMVVLENQRVTFRPARFLFQNISLISEPPSILKSAFKLSSGDFHEEPCALALCPIKE